ncbi:helix-turn-helix transcriptional regulator [Streptomyces sp. TRM 70361]|uniref:helix-turn-helix transcriptional regulator n=1 Tax=Streptomyces sp. TRM 70361 TaxID=3116553 RepID=UPI002E7ABAEB|nr:helix-turn-helix transcriptional regulator [Streptomyces sp. TRM 70361]MEE1942155.1 helix-turn-helix transcriptional regulator [Streptomyces sp. TRM 70361]
MNDAERQWQTAVDGEGADRETDKVDPVLKVIGKQIKVLRERMGLTQPEFGRRIGYGVDQVSSVERGRRPPKEQFIEGAERELDGRGIFHAVREDIEETRYPARFREFAKLEREAVEIHMYDPMVVPGPLQTEDYARALYLMRRPGLDEETVEGHVAARLARRAVFERRPAPLMSFVVEETALRRPLGGREVLRGQLRHLLGVGRLHHVDLQVMPLEVEEHAGLVGSLALLETPDRPKVAYTEAQERSAWFTERADVRVFEAQYGTIRAQALTPRESVELVEQLLGEM